MLSTPALLFVIHHDSAGAGVTLGSKVGALVQGHTEEMSRLWDQHPGPWILSWLLRCLIRLVMSQGSSSKVIQARAVSQEASQAHAFPKAWFHA